MLPGCFSIAKCPSPRLFAQLRDIWEFPKIRGTFSGGPYNKDYSILGSILGSPYLGKLPYIVVRLASGQILLLWTKPIFYKHFGMCLDLFKDTTCETQGFSQLQKGSVCTAHCCVRTSGKFCKQIVEKDTQIVRQAARR